MSLFQDFRGSGMAGRSAARRAGTKQRQLGFSILELTVVVSIMVTVLAVAVPSATSITRNYRIAGDARVTSAELNLARMRAAADFTHARVYMNLSANTFHLEIWNKTSACWQTDGDTNACTVAGSPVISLGVSDTFGFGTLTTGPTAATSTIAQAPACTVGVAGAAPGSTIANTACIEFNSRGYPVKSTNAIVANDAIYMMNSNQNLYAGVAVSISGQPTAYSYKGSSTWAQF